MLTTTAQLYWGKFQSKMLNAWKAKQTSNKIGNCDCWSSNLLVSPPRLTFPHHLSSSPTNHFSTMPASVSHSTSYVWPAQAKPSRSLVARQNNGTTEPSADSSQQAAASSAAPAQSSSAQQGEFPLHSAKFDVFVDLIPALSLRLCVAIDVKIPPLLLLLHPLKHLNHNHHLPRTLLPNLHRLLLHPHPMLQRPLPKPRQSPNNRQQHQLQILRLPPKRQRHLHSLPLKLSLQHLKHHPVLRSSHNPPHLHHRHLSLPRLAQVKVPARHRLLAPAKVRVPAPKQVVKA